jgi:flagellar P-ring protein precursor FlgI
MSKHIGCSLLTMLIFSLNLLAAARVKDVARIQGVRDNQLSGYGLVVGLNKTGDRRQTIFSTQTLLNKIGRAHV